MNEYEAWHEALERLAIAVQFTPGAARDFRTYHKDQKRAILALILKQAEKNPRMKPGGCGIPLHGELHGLVKIKSKATSLRVVYRPIERPDGTAVMEIIAIGPREREEVYRLAAQRIAKPEK